MILINKTYSVITEESAENGDFAEAGFVFENVPYTFKELVRLMRDYPIPSYWPCGGETHAWLSDSGRVDYCTGDETIESIHYAHGQPAHNARYWRLAMIAAGHAKRGAA